MEDLERNKTDPNHFAQTSTQYPWSSKEQKTNKKTQQEDDALEKVRLAYSPTAYVLWRFMGPDSFQEYRPLNILVLQGKEKINETNRNNCKINLKTNIKS